MHVKSAALISVSLLALLILVIMGLFYHTAKNKSLNIKVSERVEKGTKEENETFSDQTVQSVEVPGHTNLLRPELLNTEYLEKWHELSKNSDLTSLQDLKKLQEILDKHIAELKAHGMYHPLREPDPTIEKAKQTIAEADAFLVKSNREIEEQKQIVFEMSESIDRFTKKTRERSRRVKAWLDQIENTKSTNTSPTETKLTPINTSAWQNDVDTYMTMLDDDIVNKYPMATFVQSLSKEEIDNHFTTDSKSFLQSQQKQMVTDITQRVNKYLSENVDNRTDKINYIHEKLSQYWDEDIVKQISSQLK